MDWLAAEPDLEAALPGLASGGIGRISRVVEVLEAAVGLLSEFLVQLREVKRELRPFGTVKLA